MRVMEEKPMDDSLHSRHTRSTAQLTPVQAAGISVLLRKMDPTPAAIRNPPSADASCDHKSALERTVYASDAHACVTDMRTLRAAAVEGKRQADQRTHAEASRRTPPTSRIFSDRLDAPSRVALATRFLFQEPHTITIEKPTDRKKQLMAGIRELFAAAGSSGSMGVSATSSTTQLAASECTRALSNTLTTQCYSSCQQSSPLCVNYAARPSNESLKEGDGDYYYQGCAYTYMATCASSVGAAQCQLQCLQSKNELNEEWILDVNQPQADRLETSLYVHVDKLSLPSSLKHIKLVGTTEASRRVPMSFEKEAFTSGSGLQKITLMDLDIGAITSNIFPSNLSTLIMQRTLLTKFEPAGGAQLAELRVLDLSENQLTTIPTAVFDYQGLSELHLQKNNISNVHLTSTQLSFLRQLDVFDATIEVTNGCSTGYALYTWDTKSVCYGDPGANDTLGGNIPQSDNQPSSSSTAKTTKMGVIIASIAGFVVLAILVGIFFLKRAKKRKNDARKSLIPPENTHKLKLSASVRTLLSHKPSELANPLRDMSNGGLSPSRKSTFREIPAAEVREIEVVAETSAVIVSLGEYNKKKVLINRLRVSDDPAVNCETALGVSPVVAQLRHPQLLTVLGFMWEDVHTMSAICEHVDRGTLEDYLLAASASLTWRHFKLKAAMEIASCLMYLHGQSYKLTYDGLSGRTVFVDSAKGCKLSTMIACLPNGLVKSHLAKTTRGFCAPEVMAGEPSMPASDMYAFGVLLAQIDTCETAEQMIRSSLRQRSVRDLNNFTDSNSTATSLQEEFTSSGSSRSGLLNSIGSSGSSSSLQSMFGFTTGCPEVVKELAESCLQIDPKLRPSAQYVTAMLQHSL